ncbi:hypothetical protein BCA37_18745 [Mycobacterium sp. djl-10]|nr:hypothetical protein BCA37_18745 [Mycobacterium sp. djl-10]
MAPRFCCAAAALAFDAHQLRARVIQNGSTLGELIRDSPTALLFRAHYRPSATSQVRRILEHSPTPSPTYFLGGTDYTGTGIVTDADIARLLDGHLTGATNVPYPRAATGMDGSIAVGADTIVDIVDEAPEPMRIAGISQGAMAIAAKRELMARDEADRPAPSSM